MRRAARADDQSPLVCAVLTRIAQAGLPEPELEYRFAALETGGVGRGVRARLAAAGLRDWRFDLAWPSRMVAMEIDGGTWSGGRHTRGAGYRGDCEKRNAATLRGWRVYHATADMVRDGSAVVLLEQALVGAPGGA